MKKDWVARQTQHFSQCWIVVSEADGNCEIHRNPEKKRSKSMAEIVLHF